MSDDNDYNDELHLVTHRITLQGRQPSCHTCGPLTDDPGVCVHCGKNECGHMIANAPAYYCVRGWHHDLCLGHAANSVKPCPCSCHVAAEIPDEVWNDTRSKLMTLATKEVNNG